MKVDYISDTHFDFWVKETNTQSHKFKKLLNKFIKDVLKIKETDSEVLIIAGDLGHNYKQDTTLLLELKKYYKHLIITYGNHDMYLVSNTIQKRYSFNSMKRIFEMAKFCKENDIHYLDGNTVVINGVSFGGTGMSWDCNYAIKNHNSTEEKVRKIFPTYMNDARLIMDGNKPLRILGKYGLFETINEWDQKEFYNNQTAQLQNIDSVDVVVTHYGPIVPPDLRKEYNNINTTFYYFDGLEEVKRINPKYWIFGHTHDHHNWKENNTEFLVNPIGYPTENSLDKIGIKTFNI